MVEHDLSDMSENEKASTSPYGDLTKIFHINQPEILPPDDVINNAIANADPRNVIVRNRTIWAAIKGWKSNPERSDETHGPTFITNPYYQQDAQPFDYPEGVVYYPEVFTPCGVYVDITPSVVSLNVNYFTINPTPSTLVSGLIFDTSSGSLRGIPSSVLTRTRFIVSAITSTGNIRTSFYLTVYSPTAIPQMNYHNTNVAATGVAFSLTPLTWIIPNGSVPILSPSLPAGLSFASATGVINGTPTTPQKNTSYQVRCLGGSGSPLSATIFGENFALAVCGTGYPSALYPFALSTLPINVGATAIPTRWQNIGAAVIIPTLPTGMSFVSSTGNISGTPTVASGPTVFRVFYSGTGAFANIDENTGFTLTTCSVSNPAPSTIHWEIIPVTTSAIDWPDEVNGFGTFSALYIVKDYRGANVLTSTIICGDNTTHKHPFKYVIEKSTDYVCNIFLRNGSYPGFQLGTRNGTWNSIFRTNGIKGVRFIAESQYGAKIQTGNRAITFESVTGLNVAPWVVSVPGATRDISFSGIYFSGMNAGGTKSILQSQNVSAQVVPGLHLYDCWLDGKRRDSRWLARLYNADDHRFIRCKFTDNWQPAGLPLQSSTEHAVYYTGDFGVNFFEDCLFSGIGRNAIQLAQYKDYAGGQPDPNAPKPVPSSLGGWVVKNCSAIQCGMSSWKLNAAGTPQFVINGNGTVAFTFAGCSAVWMLGCMVSGGYHPVYDYTNINRGLGALVVWKQPYPSISDPGFYGNKIFVLSSCTFDVKDPELSLINLKNIRQLWVSGGTYRGENRPIFQLSSHAIASGNTEEQSTNPNNLPYIASAFFNFPLNTTTFPLGYPPYITANCLPFSSCQTLTQNQWETLVNAADQPPPTPPTKPVDGTFRFQAGWTNLQTGLVTL